MAERGTYIHGAERANPQTQTRASAVPRAAACASSHASMSTPAESRDSRRALLQQVGGAAAGLVLAASPLSALAEDTMVVDAPVARAPPLFTEVFRWFPPALSSEVLRSRSTDYRDGMPLGDECRAPRASRCTLRLKPRWIPHPHPSTLNHRRRLLFSSLLLSSLELSDTQVYAP